ncbi:hypothetical protein E2R51_02335 [Jeotgalibacillus sp. S-D1]|uniref:hypothetical protein n=1 Tax=Jeotgalibacillus sp. S-D1 TaxID=2552189 RepID=UPI001059B3ED|nr:hypothetical protein [Jeotgalibacillus sp. S-D1]TDL34575.1 hypothetical protein E2R51_02335 [Jeotgalibacillus sp. S-D1]
MSWDYEVELLSFVESVDSDGFPLESQEESIAILANKLPVRSTEFYSASRAGFTIEKTFEVNSIEYSGQEDLRFDGDIYRIRRTYEKDHIIELYCEKKGESHAG